MARKPAPVPATGIEVEGTTVRLPPCPAGELPTNRRAVPAKKVPIAPGQTVEFVTRGCGVPQTFAAGKADVTAGQTRYRQLEPAACDPGTYYTIPLERSEIVGVPPELQTPGAQAVVCDTPEGTRVQTVLVPRERVATEDVLAAIPPAGRVCGDASVEPGVTAATQRIIGDYPTFLTNTFDHDTGTARNARLLCPGGAPISPEKQKAAIAALAALNLLTPRPATGEADAGKILNILRGEPGAGDWRPGERPLTAAQARATAEEFVAGYGRRNQQFEEMGVERVAGVLLDADRVYREASKILRS